MVQCVKNLLEGKEYGPVPVITVASAEKALLSANINQPVYHAYVVKLDRYLKMKLGKDTCIWFHLDEHGKMIERDYGDSCKTTYRRKRRYAW